MGRRIEHGPGNCQPDHAGLACPAEKQSQGGMNMRQPGKLLRILGLGFGLAAVVGSMVGQGILRTPGMVAGAVHSPALIVVTWVSGGLIAAISAFSYIELGAAIPSAGGPYDYADRAFGRLAGAITGWTLMLAMAAAAAGVNYVVGEFAVRLGVLPGAQPWVPAMAALALFWWLNWSGTRVSGDTQILFSAAKGAVLTAMMIALFMHRGPPANLPSTPLTGAVGLAGLAMAMRLIVSAYNGWQDIAIYCEELEDPARTLPRSLLGGLAAVGALYVLFNLALLHVLSPAQMAGSNLPAADAMAQVLGDRASTAITLFGVLSVSAITSLSIMGTTRITFALARGGLLPSALAQVSANGTPRAALTFVVGVVAAFVITGSYNTLSSTSTSLYQIGVVMALASVIGLRRREPDLPRPYRAALYPVSTIIALLANLALLGAFIYDDPFNALLGVGIVAVLTLGWLASMRWRRAETGRTGE